MTDPDRNTLTMAETCLALIQSAEHAEAVATAPTALPENVTALSDAIDHIHADDAAAKIAAVGHAEAKTEAEETLEQVGFAKSRALRKYHKDKGNTALATVFNINITDLVELRDGDLSARVGNFRDAAAAAVADDAVFAAARGINAGFVSALTTAIADYDAIRNAPRAGISNRHSYNNDVRIGVAGLEGILVDIDDLLLQLPEGEAQRHLQTAWATGRKVVHAGHGPGDEDDEPGTLGPIANATATVEGTSTTFAGDLPAGATGAKLAIDSNEPTVVTLPFTNNYEPGEHTAVMSATNGTIDGPPTEPLPFTIA